MRDLRSSSQGRGERQSEGLRPPYSPPPLLAWHPPEDAMNTGQRTQESSEK